MRIKRKIPSFIFGVSIGLLIGVAFFLFKMDSIFSKLKNSISANKITVIEKKMKRIMKKQKPEIKNALKSIPITTPR
jgi:CRISPR/Cas system CMR-associated protein Cmr5 small subunit